MCFLVTTCYFETKLGTHNPIAKSTSRCDSFLLLSKIIFVILFTFLKKKGDNQWILTIFLLFFGGYMTYSYYEYSPYYHSITKKMYNCLCLLNLWSVIVLFLGKILESSKFDGTLGLFFVGLPVNNCLRKRHNTRRASDKLDKDE